MSPDDKGSLAYRRHADAIWDGSVPEKYLRLLPYIVPHLSGRRVLELGAAEGVLSLLLAVRDPSATIVALEMQPDRHAAGLALQKRWRALGRKVNGCHMICGDIRALPNLLYGVNTVVAIRTIYHLQESITDVFGNMWARGVSNVVLAGNPNRARWPDCTAKAAALGRWNRYAGVPGMTEVLAAAGYTIGTVVAEGDPIVTGHR